MSGYTPRPGDRVRVTYEATVRSIPGGSPVVLNPGAGGWFIPSAFPSVQVELIEPAPVSFVVGGGITEEMGEPPNHSIVTDRRGNAWERLSLSWWCTVLDRGSSWEVLQQLRPLTLLRRGDGTAQ